MKPHTRAGLFSRSEAPHHEAPSPGHAGRASLPGGAVGGQVRGDRFGGEVSVDGGMKRFLDTRAARPYLGDRWGDRFEVEVNVDGGVKRFLDTRAARPYPRWGDTRGGGTGS